MAASSPPSVGIVGGGLSGLAAAVALSEFGVPVALYEARRRLGGRAGSFRDPDTTQWVDHCQHVSMGCCRNYADFCRRTDTAHLFRRYRRLHFFAPDGRRYDLKASWWLPAPLHLAPSLLRLGYLTLADRLSVGRALMRLVTGATDTECTMDDWLRRQGQSESARERFWNVVLVSALSESLDRIALSAAKKVFVDGFMASRDAYVVEVPRVPLDELYDRTADWLERAGATLHRATAVKGLELEGRRVVGLRLAEGRVAPCDHAIVAVPWRRLPDVLATLPDDVLSDLRGSAALEASPISSLHLWFDRPLSPLSHAVLVGRLSQWVFFHEATDGMSNGDESYYQVVISASRDLLRRDRQEVCDEVLADLAAIWPESTEARLLRWRLVTQHEAVFSPLPGSGSLRPAQATSLENLFLAGDWTQTGWPATMESAVRSGYLAAEGVLQRLGRAHRIVCPEQRCWAVRWLLK